MHRAHALGGRGAGSLAKAIVPRLVRVVPAGISSRVASVPRSSMRIVQPAATSVGERREAVLDGAVPDPPVSSS